MGEAKEKKEEFRELLGSNGLWRVTDGAEKVLMKEKVERLHIRELVERLERCTVCGGKAKLVQFGVGGNGAWIGCDRTERCGRYIEFHEIGWSIDEVAAEWNRYNSGIRRVIRKVKGWIGSKVDKVAKEERKQRKAKIEAEKAKEAKMRELFGIEERKGIRNKIEGIYRRIKRKVKMIKEAIWG